MRVELGVGGGNAITFLSFSRDSSSDSLDANYTVFLLEEKNLESRPHRLLLTFYPLNS